MIFFYILFIYKISTKMRIPANVNYVEDLEEYLKM